MRKLKQINQSSIHNYNNELVDLRKRLMLLEIQVKRLNELTRDQAKLNQLVVEILKLEK